MSSDIRKHGENEKVKINFFLFSFSCILKYLLATWLLWMFIYIYIYIYATIQTLNSQYIYTKLLFHLAKCFNIFTIISTRAGMRELCLIHIQSMNGDILS